MRERDVIVVGAGPAGAVAASALAQRGRDVLLLDRSDFPRDKTCGDGIPPGTIEVLDEIGAGERIRHAGFFAVDGIRIGSPSGRIWDADFRPKHPGNEFYIAPRVQFDALLKDYAVSSGAEFRKVAVKAPLFDGDRVCGVRAQGPGVELELRARAVVGADGVTSVIGRALRKARPPARMRAVAMRAYVDGLSALPNKVEFYFYRDFLPGYGWIFPIDATRANVGVILRADRYRAGHSKLPDLLQDFLSREHMRGRLLDDARIRDESSWQLPLATPKSPRRGYDGAVLVGDAGGFVDALTGEGIHHALRSALVASEVVDEALSEGRTSLELFDQRCEEALGYLIRRSYRLHEHVATSAMRLEALFIGASLAGPLFHRWLNRISTDFEISASQ